ncbi:DUF1513 domain-containing protein [Marinomonas agarivorans]|nr:DUF1513 domain-containing protein [Marinomonas agarivorans]
MRRRAFLKNTLYCAGLVSWSRLLAASKAHTLDKTPFYASAFTDKNGKHAFALFDHRGEIHWQTMLENRAHAPVFHPQQAIVGIVARRPGFYLDLYDIASAQKISRFTPSNNHHFYGHSTFTRDGNYLLTTENHYTTGEGKIVVRDWQHNQIVHEFSSYGIGPHELHLLTDTILVVANGGLQTHPQTERRILNIESMHSNLAFIDLNSGQLLSTKALPAKWQKLSLRHIDVTPNKEVVIGFQHQGNKFDNVPLIGKTSLENEQIDIMPMPAQIQQRFQQYCGSVAIDQSGQILAASSPRGGIVAYWQLQTGHFLTSHNYRDVCGLALTHQPHEFLLTTGQGKRVITNPITAAKTPLPTTKSYHWDNHIHSIFS